MLGRFPAKAVQSIPKVFEVDTCEENLASMLPEDTDEVPVGAGVVYVEIVR